LLWQRTFRSGPVFAATLNAAVAAGAAYGATQASRPWDTVLAVVAAVFAGLALLDITVPVVRRVHRGD
jgi:hypothetical protein